MRWLPLCLLCLLLSGCALSRNESTLARLHDEMAAKKAERPKDFPSEDQLGVKYYPGCDYVQAPKTDEFGKSLIGADLSTADSADKVRDFYEKQLGAKAMPTVAPFYSIQRDYKGRHYQVDYGRMGDETTISIKVYPLAG